MQCRISSSPLTTSLAASFRPRKSACQKQVCRASVEPRSDEIGHLSRRDLMTVASVGVPLLSLPGEALAAQAAPVGDYMPSAGVDDFVLFVPDKQKTPAIRAGTVDPNNPYRFALPPTWREGKVANILSGNYCQPRCDEPWTEVIFENAEEGRAALLASPLFKLTPRKVNNISDIGTPEGIIFSIGPYITGTFLDEEDVTSATETTQDDGEVYYYYEVNSPFAKFGQHIVTSATVKGEVALLFVVSASEKQWAKSQSKIKKMVKTFRA
ncbi:hypothetical protein BSKO_11583 [Bryopsis sp. KO-2023]|nr:hypothetical protein BSKO_11583 [Bryopsis sp. KO-2023]